MTPQDWTGVLPAITTPLNPDQSIDRDGLAKHVAWLMESGCQGVVALGSLGEGATMNFAEKVEIIETSREAIGGSGVMIAGISGLATGECVRLARAAQAAGCDALMVLPPYVHKGDWREIEAHFSAVIRATPLPCMLYNNPIAYGTDLQVPHIEALCRYPNVRAVKESSGDVRRVTAIKEALGDRVQVLAGLDDMIVEAVYMGGSGWIAGLANALPAESIRLFELARAGKRAEAKQLYDWFLPLLRLDTVPKFVQLIKLVQVEVGRGAATVRLPRLELEGAELDAALKIIRRQLAEPVTV